MWDFKDQVVGRGGFVATRNYELDSDGACFLNNLCNHHVSKDICQPELLLEEPMTFEAIMLMVDTWTMEQHHDKQLPCRCFELEKEGKGKATTYTGMTWSGFRPSDDACNFGYLVPANIHAAAGLERMLILNERTRGNVDLQSKVSKLLKEIEEGVNLCGIVNHKNGERTCAYEVDGMAGVSAGFDDANVPSLLLIPLLGWSGYDPQVCKATRKALLSNATKHCCSGEKLTGIGSPHAPRDCVWPMALVVEGLTKDGESMNKRMAFQMRQLLLSAKDNVMHESVSAHNELHVHGLNG
jgi:meiotically up-regulated gene 157 (Mug157) protein